MDGLGWGADLWKKVRLRLRYEAIYLWPGWPPLSAFNVGHAPPRPELLGDERFGHQAPNIEIYAALADLLERRRRFDEAARVMEIGCGRGGGLAYLASRMAGRVGGVDTSLAAVLLARRQGLDASWRDGGRLPCRDGSLDAVVAVETVVLFGLAGRVLPAARRALKPGGVLALAEFRPHGFARARQEIIALARTYGFRVATILDRTEAARRAVVEDEPRRRAVYDRLPAFAQREVADTLSLRGTRRYESWVGGERSYVLTLLSPLPLEAKPEPLP